MVGATTGVATHINETESHAHLTHYHSHVLQLIFCETIKEMKIMRGTLDASFEFNKLQIFSKKTRSFQ